MAQIEYPAHGWLPPGAHLELKWDDQGRDFATNWQGGIQAPGAGVCLEVLSDQPFPNGFGPAYPVVRIDDGPWKGHEYYIGHTTTAVRAGQHFKFGDFLSHADQGHNWAGTTGGWVELGEAFGGLPGPKQSSHWFDSLIQTPLVVTVPDPDPYSYSNYPVGPFPFGPFKLNERATVQEYDKLGNSIKDQARRVVLKVQIKFLRDRVKYVAKWDTPPSWSVDFRGWRWQRLNDRLNGVDVRNK